MNDALLDRIRPVTRRLRSVRFWYSLAVTAIIAGLAGWMLKRQVDAGEVAGSALAMVLLGIVLGVALITAIVCRFSYRDPRVVAKQIEKRFPSLDQRLLTALSQQDNQLGYLQQRVVKEARDHSRTHRWVEAVPAGQLIGSRLSGLGATAFLRNCPGNVGVDRSSGRVVRRLTGGDVGEGGNRAGQHRGGTRLEPGGDRSIQWLGSRRSRLGLYRGGRFRASHHDDSKPG